MTAGPTLTALVLVAGLGGGCERGATRREDRPVEPQPREDSTMTTNLREVVEQAIAHPEDHADLTISYLRGHDLSGTTRLEVTAAGAYQLASSVVRDEQPHTWSGDLTAADRAALLRAILDTGLLDARSSTRNLHDDEEPIFVTVRSRSLVHEVKVWHGDATATGLAGFEAHVVALAHRLSGGAILTIPAR